jgi:hypothetical protein
MEVAAVVAGVILVLRMQGLVQFKVVPEEMAPQHQICFIAGLITSTVTALLVVAAVVVAVVTVTNHQDLQLLVVMAVQAVLEAVVVAVVAGIFLE